MTGWPDIEAALDGVLGRRWYTNHGPLARQLESLAAQRFGVTHAIAATNPTIAMLMLAEAMGLVGAVLVPCSAPPRCQQALRWAGFRAAGCGGPAGTRLIGMRLAIMQPYFFPYPGHFSLIASSDRWIVFDITQYTPRSWMNRNLLPSSSGHNWMTVPIAQSSIHMRTHEARILDPAAAGRRILGQLSHYRHAPFYREVTTLVADVFDGAGASLVTLNVKGLAAVCRYIGLPFDYQICSELALPLPADLGPGGWAPAICAALNASAYVNPVGGRALFDPANFDRHSIGLHFIRARPFEYDARQHGTVSNLSILDALMWNAPDVVRDAVCRVSLLD